MIRQGDLLEIIEAGRPAGGLTSRLHGRQEQRHQEATNGNDHQQFHEGESVARSIRMTIPQVIFVISLHGDFLSVL